MRGCVATALALWTVASAACTAGGRARREATPLLPLQVEALDGSPFTLGGDGPVRLVEVWATWCAPCGPAASSARAVLARHPRVEAYAISVDQDRAALLLRLAEDPPPGKPLVLRGGPGAAARLGLSALPAFLVLDARGRLTGTLFGFSPGLGPELTRLIVRAEGKWAEPD